MADRSDAGLIKPKYLPSANTITPSVSAVFDISEAILATRPTGVPASLMTGCSTMMLVTGDELLASLRLTVASASRTARRVTMPNAAPSLTIGTANRSGLARNRVTNPDIVAAVGMGRTAYQGSDAAGCGA